MNNYLHNIHSYIQSHGYGHGHFYHHYYDYSLNDNGQELDFIIEDKRKLNPEAFLSYA